MFHPTPHLFQKQEMADGGGGPKPPNQPPAELPPETQNETPPDAGPVRVELRSPGGNQAVPREITGGLATQWSYTVRHRRRWEDSLKARQSLAERALKTLDELGIPKTVVSDLGKAGIVEVAIPYRSESEGWAARILPWEFLLRTATGKPELTVVRHLDVQSETKPRPPLSTPSTLLFVKSAPGPLGDYSFDTERCLIKGSFTGSLLLPVEELDDPSAQELSEWIKANHPSVIHLAGFDVHQGDDYCKRRAAAEEKEKGQWDGMYFAGETAKTTDRVKAERLGMLLNPKGASGALITFNLYYSAARLAAMAVAHGAAAAVGFQDVVDDQLAERFFASLFQQWRTRDWNLFQAFHEAWRRVGFSGHEDSGVMLWTGTSLMPAERPGKRKVAAPKLEIGPDKGSVFRVRVTPNPDINYSMLHNGAGLFKTFRFEKYEPRYAHGIKVDVALHMGTETLPYHATFDLDADDPLLDIAKHVNLPLTSQVARSLREDLLTSLHVCVSYDGTDVYQDTHRVKLLAVNQWCFDRSAGGRWLASFVLPGDPAVPRIIDAAQKYLMALRDDPAAGFDGYQSTDLENAERRDEGVDMQVRAIWAALSFDLPLSYINPPPVFTEGSQRLRTPSDVVGGKRGTCIDLALLFAACLEYVDIYPVLFLLTDHAFPGYWRNEASYDGFLEMGRAPQTEDDGYDASAAAQNRMRFEEVRQLVRDGSLVPLETVWLTTHRGFAEAVDAGIDNLRSSRNFESLVNIRKLRDEKVTPLPIAGDLR